jgi:hypothetical protein
MILQLLLQGSHLGLLLLQDRRGFPGNKPKPGKMEQWSLLLLRAMTWLTLARRRSTREQKCKGKSQRLSKIAAHSHTTTPKQALASSFALSLSNQQHADEEQSRVCFCSCAHAVIEMASICSPVSSPPTSAFVPAHSVCTSRFGSLPRASE